MLPVAMGNYFEVMIYDFDGFEVQSLEEASKTKSATNKQTIQKKWKYTAFWESLFGKSHLDDDANDYDDHYHDHDDTG